MQIQINFKGVAQSLIVVSILGLITVSIIAFENPKSLMDLVEIRMTDDTVVSAIRELYGGIGLMLLASLLCLMCRDVIIGLAFSSLLWCFYGLSKIATVFSDGVLGALGRQWLLVESSLCLFALILFWANHKAKFVFKSTEHDIN